MEKRTNWFELWFADKQSMLETMIRNMQADLDAGYNYFGNCITRQREAIDAYKESFDFKMEQFADMSDDKVQRYCYYDLKKRGVIA